MNKIKEVFYPSEEKLKQIDNLIKETTKEAIKNRNCIVCEYYDYDAFVPGFVTYEGDCQLNQVPFFKGTCKLWKLKNEYISFQIEK